MDPDAAVEKPEAVAARHTCRFVQLSLLNCLCAAIPARERVIASEEVFELSKASQLHK